MNKYYVFEFVPPDNGLPKLHLAYRDNQSHTLCGIEIDYREGSPLNRWFLSSYFLPEKVTKATPISCRECGLKYLKEIGEIE